MVEVAALTLRHVSQLHRVRRKAVECATAVLGPERGDDVALVVSELSTNALQHGAGEGVCVRLGTDGDVLLVEVVGTSDGEPAIVEAAPDGVGGRGLRIVREVADALTVATSGRDVRVSCRFERA